jgi:regulatory protein YycH of two-component signal transduction system YycFG
MSYGPTYNPEKSDETTVHTFCLNAHEEIGVVKLDSNSLTFMFFNKVRFKIPDITQSPMRYFIYRSSYTQDAEQQIKKAHKQCENIQKSSSVKSALKRYIKTIKKQQEELKEHGGYTKDIGPYASAYIIDLQRWTEIHLAP